MKKLVKILTERSHTLVEMKTAAVPFLVDEVTMDEKARAKHLTPDVAPLLTDPAALKDFTAANLSTPIHWQRVVETLVRSGVDLVFECGHGVSLTQNARFLQSAPRHANVRNWRRAL